MKNYVSEIKRSMKYLSKDNKSIFIGQAVDVPGNLIYKSLIEIPSSKNFLMKAFLNNI